MARVWSKVFICLLFIGCQKPAKDPCTHFEGWEMTMPYRVTIGKHLSRSEKKRVASVIEKTFAEVDALFNNWNPESEVSRFNTASAGVPFLLSPPLQELLHLCEKIVQLSSGRFDPTMYPLFQIWHTSLNEKQFPSPELLQKGCDASGWNHLLLKGNALVKDHPETRLDLCAISKGLCIDWLVERLQAMGYPDLFIEWAGEIRASGLHPEGKPWVVQIDPGLTMGGRPIAPLSLKNGAIACSGDAGQKGWVLPPCASPDGQIHRFFHIIDPFTGQPLEKTEASIAAVSVIAPTCALADALATAAMVFPSQKEAEDWAQEVVTLYPDVSFWILSYDIQRK